MQLIAVDDEPLALKDLIAVVEKTLKDAEIKGFTDSAEALEYIEKRPPDLAFLDIKMEGLNGLELAKQLRELNGEVNIIFVTGYSEYALDAFSVYASGYLLKPITEKAILQTMQNLRYPIPVKADRGLRVQTFGNFEVFLDGEPLNFPRSKAKELFAYLIHKRGSSCSTREIAAVLFEDQPYTLSLQKQMQTLFSTMMRTLREAGVEDCVIRGYNRTAINVAKVDCDYYRFLNWDAGAISKYTGEYMTNYGWAEFIVGYLNNRVL